MYINMEIWLINVLVQEDITIHLIKFMEVPIISSGMLEISEILSVIRMETHSSNSKIDNYHYLEISPS